MKKLLLLLLIVPMISFGQTKEELELCLFAQTNSFSSDNNAENALNRILGVIGASKNFVLIPCSEINNALATSFKGIRYILYDKTFMRLLNSRTNDWSSLTILAHEVGHHINGHALDLTMFISKVVEPKSLAAKRKQELEADEFAGFIMAKLGAPLNQVESAISLLSSDKDDTYSTHPSKSKRLNALKIGYNKAGISSGQQKEYLVNDSTMSAEHYFNKGMEKYKLKDYYGGIAEFNKLIELQPDAAWAYYYRGVFKVQLKDRIEAILDFSIAIELSPDNDMAYYDRGRQKIDAKDYLGAIEDFNSALKNRPNFASAFANRGIANRQLKNYYSAISDFNMSIKLDPDYASTYNNRAITKSDLGDHNGAILDYNTAIKLKPDFNDAYENRGDSRRKLEDYYGAIADYNKVIKMEPDNADNYYYRGISKGALGDRNGACNDMMKAANLGKSSAADKYRKLCN